jgi:polysaccharide export outer membrane protein
MRQGLRRLSASAHAARSLVLPFLGAARREMLVVGACCAVVACGSQPPPPALAETAPVGTPRYVIGPLDQVQVFVAGAPELSVSVPVHPDGWISIPMVQDIQAAGKTPNELAAEIETALRPYVQDPEVSVVVQQFADTSAYTVRVMGAVANPMAVPYRPNMTVLDAMVAADGLDEFAAGNRAVLIRTRPGGGEDVYKLRLEDLLDEADLSANAPVLPGDVIMVPEGLL